MCRICVSLGLVRSIPESRFLVLFLACVFSLNPIFELLLGRGHTQARPKSNPAIKRVPFFDLKGGIREPGS